MLFDAYGLGYTARHGEIFVHYPVYDRSVDRHAPPKYEAGFPLGNLDHYWNGFAVVNAVTAERMLIWKQLL